MGRPFSACMNCIFTAFLWVPGIGHALVCYADYKGTVSVRQLTKAINNPQHARVSSNGQSRVRRPREVVEVVVYDNPHVGKNGTYFRRKN
jgi:hypothetical protein